MRNKILILLLLIYFLFTPQVAIGINNTIFEENFENYPNGSFPSRWEKINYFNANMCQQEWTVENGKLKISINNSGSCTTNIIPKDSEWMVNSDNYIFEAEMTFIKGEDHNIIFRTNPEVPFFYEMHFHSPGDFDLFLPNLTVIYIKNDSGIYPNTSKYKVKFVMLDNQMQVYINDVLVRDVKIDKKFPSGRIGLRAGVGDNHVSETLFDDIKVTPLTSSTLDVPYFNQNDEPWNKEEYDHANKIKFQNHYDNPYFERWGCAVTSAAMILNYHEMTKLNNGSLLNPGSLNKWLKENKGYAMGLGIGNSKPYSSLIWGKIGTLTQNLYDANNANYKLVVNPFVKNPNLKNDLTQKEIADKKIAAPPIVRVSKLGYTDGHYVVPNGISNNTIMIKDPEWNFKDLTEFDNNIYTDYHSFTPSLSDFSSLYFVVNENVELEVTDQRGNKTGTIAQYTINNISNQIPNAVYAFEGPIGNPNDSGLVESLGFGANIFSLNFPENGIYKLVLSSNENTYYTINLSTFQTNGNHQLSPYNGVISPSFNKEFIINYSRNSDSTIQEKISVNSLISDIYTLNNIGEFKNQGIYKSLLKKAENAIKAQDITKLNILSALKNELEAQRGKGITEDAYAVLKSDINYLLKY